jgi:hypothetical protein
LTGKVWFFFVFVKTIPLFCIPAHSITFILPPENRVLAAAYLVYSIRCNFCLRKRERFKVRIEIGIKLKTGVIYEKIINWK